MSITYYPSRINNGKVPAIDREMAKRNIQIEKGAHNINASPLDVTISNNADWQINSIGWSFSDILARDFSAFIKEGRRVVANLNDYLWFDVPAVSRQRIVLDEAFYTGTELATHLKLKMDANTVYSVAGITFAVSYNAATGLFTVTPSSGTIRYLHENLAQTVPNYASIAGGLFGLTTDGTLGATSISDTTVFGLDTEVPFVAETGSIVETYSHNELHTMEVDQALHLTTNSGILLTVDYNVNHEVIV